MTETEYIEKYAKQGVIGICELCRNYRHCADNNRLKEDGCDNHSNFSEE